MGVFILLKPIGEFKVGAIGNIVHHRNLVTGIITADNGDKSYAVEIGESGKSTKKIFTLSPDPDLAVGDKARVLYRGGNKEDMILLAPTKPAIVVAGYIFVYCWTAEHGYCIKSYTANGVYISTFSVSELQDWNNVLAVDADNNVYCVLYNLLKCHDKDGNLLYQVSVPISSVCNGPDGHIYTYEMQAEWGEIRFAKRAPGDSTIIESKAPSSQAGTQALIMDSNKNIYITRYTGTGTEKYNFNDTPPLPVIAYNADIWSYQRTLAVVNGILSICGRWGEEVKTAKLDLSAYIDESFDFATITWPRGLGNVGNDYLCVAYDNSNDYAVLGRYNSNGIKIWETNIGTFADTTVYQVAAYPF